MSAITRFEDIEAWQQARTLAGEVYALCRAGDLARDRGLRDQMQRAAVSVMANIAEGFGRQGRKELIQFLRIARGSCTELQSHFYLAKDAELLTAEQFSALQVQADRTGRKISAFINYLVQSERNNGPNSVQEDWPIYAPDNLEPPTNNE